MIVRRALTLAAALSAAILCMGAAMGTAPAADDPLARLPDPVKEARARHLFQQLRCVVCQNESIDDSQADIAADLRRIVRTQIAAGRTDAQVRDFLVQRYGEFILLKPTLTPGNAALWLTPFLLIAVGGVYIWSRSRRPVADSPALTEDEQEALAALDRAPPDIVSPYSGPTNARGRVAIKH